MTHDLVWMSTRRQGLAYHTVAGRNTVCGRHVGDVVDGEPKQGVLLPQDEAVLTVKAVLCKACADGPEPFRVIPGTRPPR